MRACSKNHNCFVTFYVKKEPKSQSIKLVHVGISCVCVCNRSHHLVKRLSEDDATTEKSYGFAAVKRQAVLGQVPLVIAKSSTEEKEVNS